NHAGAYLREQRHGDARVFGRCSRHGERASRGGGLPGEARARGAGAARGRGSSGGAVAPASAPAAELASPGRPESSAGGASGTTGGTPASAGRNGIRFEKAGSVSRGSWRSLSVER